MCFTCSLVAGKALKSERESFSCHSVELGSAAAAAYWIKLVPEIGPLLYMSLTKSLMGSLDIRSHLL